jgi:multidrug efflux pump subunit AcrA (membrane-fusion protein)
VFLTLAITASLLFAASCSSEKPDGEPTVSVQVAAVEKTTIEHNITAQAILFPRAQAAIVPKISAPVQKFLVKRGSAVHEGELLAVLENRDLAAAAQENKGAYDQAEASYTTTTGASLPEEIQKAEADAQQAQQALDAQEKIFESRQQLFDQGALPRKELDQSRVDITQARNQQAIAKKHLDALMAIGKQQELKSATGQLESAKGKYLGSQAQLSYSEIRSPINGFITDRPLYPGEMAAAGTPLLTVMDISSVIAKAHIPQSDAAALSITAATVKDALVVPANSVITAQDGTPAVMLAGADGRAHQKAVKLGVRNGDDVQITDGVAEGDKVIATGAYGLPDKTKIKIEAAETPGEGKDAKDSKDDKAGSKPAAGGSDEK